MSDQYAEVKQKFADQIADILRETHPHLTPNQVKKIQAESAVVLGDFSIAPLLRIQNEMIVQGLLWKQPELARAVPTSSQMRDYLIKQHREEFGEFISAQKELELAREASAMDADARLAACPASAVASQTAAPSAVEQLNATASRTMTAREIEDEEDRFIWRTLGKRPHEIDGKQRAEYLKHFHGSGPSHADQMSAQLIDQLNLRSGGNDENLSTYERMNKFRAEQALNKNKPAQKRA